MESNLGMALLLPLLAGLSTVLGSVLGFFASKPSPRIMAFVLGFAAGVMILVSFVELLPQGIATIGFLPAHIAFFVGMAIMFLLDLLIPHHYMAEERNPRSAAPEIGPRGEMSGADRHHWRRHGPGSHRQTQCRDTRLARTATLIAVGVTLHNVPEGIATFTGAMQDMRLGVVIAVAIALHNIPEGLAISVPICAATGSRFTAFLWSALSGMAEFAGALVAALFLLPFLSTTLLSAVLAAVAGIMVFISLDELVPVACSFGDEHLSILGVGIGMAVMATSLWLLG